MQLVVQRLFLARPRAGKVEHVGAVEEGRRPVADRQHEFGDEGAERGTRQRHARPAFGCKLHGRRRARIVEALQGRNAHDRLLARLQRVERRPDRAGMPDRRQRLGQPPVEVAEGGVAAPERSEEKGAVGRGQARGDGRRVVPERAERIGIDDPAEAALDVIGDVEDVVLRQAWHRRPGPRPPLRDMAGQRGGGWGRLGLVALVEERVHDHADRIRLGQKVQADGKPRRAGPPRHGEPGDDRRAFLAAAGVELGAEVKLPAGPAEIGMKGAARRHAERAEHRRFARLARAIDRDRYRRARRPGKPFGPAGRAPRPCRQARALRADEGGILRVLDPGDGRPGGAGHGRAGLCDAVLCLAHLVLTAGKPPRRSSRYPHGRAYAAA